MFHVNTEQLLDYWRERSFEGQAPARSEINPADFARLLPQVFILGREGHGRFVFRLAGELLVDLHAGKLRGADAMSTWSDKDRLRLASALESSRRRVEPFVALAEASTPSGLQAPFEIMFAPLADDKGEVSRVLGLYQPKALLAGLKGQPVRELSILRLLGARAAPSRPALRLAAVDGRRIA
jgi:hypothetical protein